jgi:hypothetical protein
MRDHTLKQHLGVKFRIGRRGDSRNQPTWERRLTTGRESQSGGFLGGLNARDEPVGIGVWRLTWPLAQGVDLHFETGVSYSQFNPNNTMAHGVLV